MGENAAQTDQNTYGTSQIGHSKYLNLHTKLIKNILWLDVYEKKIKLMSKSNSVSSK